MAAGLAITALVASPCIQHALAAEYAQPPYSNYYGFPVPWGGCDNGSTWCDNLQQSTGMMYLSDFPFSGQNDQSFVEWNVNPTWGNSPTAYYSWQYPVYWGATWDAVGSMVQTAWPFYGQMMVGGMLLECSNTALNCSGGQYNYRGLLGVYLTTNEVDGQIDYQYQSSPQWTYQEPYHLYTEVPVGYASAFANNCDNSCYGAGYTDFGLNGHHMVVRNMYAFPEE